ncbi:hypothetical protein RGQ29_004207 [Quercus rubra]|uniref:Transmembrane protein n=1 Tax=Quercus rubra TaxID=3512 RepID=A0AAN7EDU8_QUERU|nr:hypothetical protein RGQ29_004207 [Quercus rubra]
MEPNNASLTLTVVAFRILVLLKNETWNLCFVNKVWIKDIKFIPLHKLWRWVFMIIVSPIVFVPHISSVNMVHILWFPWSILVMPPINLRIQVQFINGETIF